MSVDSLFEGMSRAQRMQVTLRQMDWWLKDIGKTPGCSDMADLLCDLIGARTAQLASTARILDRSAYALDEMESIGTVLPGACSQLAGILRELADECGISAGVEPKGTEACN